MPNIVEMPNPTKLTHKKKESDLWKSNVSRFKAERKPRNAHRPVAAAPRWETSAVPSLGRRSVSVLRLPISIQIRNSSDKIAELTMLRNARGTKWHGCWTSSRTFLEDHTFFFSNYKKLITDPHKPHWKDFWVCRLPENGRICLKM